MNRAERAYRQAEAAMAEFRHEWFVKKGGLREDGVRLARAASNAVEDIWEYESRLPEQLVERAEEWLEELLHVPEIEKAWYGVKEYRKNHRVKGRAEL